MYIEKALDLLSSAHEKWWQKQHFYGFNFVQCILSSHIFSAEHCCLFLFLLIKKRSTIHRVLVDPKIKLHHHHLLMLFQTHMPFSQLGLIKMCTSVHFLARLFLCTITHCTFLHSFKEKRTVSGAKAQVQYVNPGLAHLYYVDIGMYCCVFITLLQEHILAVQNSNIWGPSLKINILSCWKYALHQTQPLTYPIVFTNAKPI